MSKQPTFGKLLASVLMPYACMKRIYAHHVHELADRSLSPRFHERCSGGRIYEYLVQLYWY